MFPGYHFFSNGAQRPTKINARLAHLMMRAKSQVHRLRGTFREVNTYCMFIGYPRSGHSLIGALLDAHPNAIIAHEVHALEQIQRCHWNRDLLFTYLLDNSQYHRETQRQWSGYSYKVEEQWQGQFETLQVIGDKRGGSSSLWIQAHRDALTQLRKTLGPSLELRVLHVVRNPFDNIATISTRHGKSISEAIDEYILYLQGAELALAELSSNESLTIHHEYFVADPRQNLACILAFLSQNVTNEYLNACASITFDSPRKSRTSVQWETDEIRRVMTIIEQHSFLHAYVKADIQ